MNAYTPFVSVIVPAYNDAEQLTICLEALSQQSYPASCFEVVVVDNASDDDIAGAAACFPGVSIEREERVGSYAARNRGIKTSKGEILAFTDADCIPDPGWIEAGVRALEEDSECGAVGGRIQMFPRDPQHVTAFDLHDLVWGMPQRVYVERFGLAATGNLFARRKAFDRVGPFNPEFRSCGDCEWNFRMTAAGMKLGYADAARVRHPTRSSMRSFVLRRRRITGGHHRLQPVLDETYPDKDFEIPRGFAPSLNRIRSSIRHKRLQSRGEKLKFIYAEILLSLVSEAEAWRLRLGGTPSRG